MKLDRKQDLNVVYQVCVFHPGQSLKKGGTLYSGARYVALWASCFCNHCMAFIKTWQEANTSSFLQSLCFLDLYVNKNGKPDLWLADTFSILLLQLLCTFEQNIYIYIPSRQHGFLEHSSIYMFSISSFFLGQSISLIPYCVN